MEGQHKRVQGGYAGSGEGPKHPLKRTYEPHNPMQNTGFALQRELLSEIQGLGQFGVGCSGPWRLHSWGFEFSP